MGYDVIIIGGGPSGLAALVYLARQKFKVLLLAGLFGGQTSWSSDVENYLGFHLIDGAVLVQKFRQHVEDYKDVVTIREGEFVQHVERLAEGFQVTTADGTYTSKTVLVAAGTSHRELGIPGEKELYGKGVTYCATCDAPLYREKEVCVVGGGNSAMDAALFAEKYCPKVTLLTVNPELRGDDVMRAKILASDRIEVVVSAKTTRITGAQFVDGIGYQGADGSERRIPCQGVFIEIGLKPSSDFIDFVAKDKGGQIVVNTHCATDVEGVWAAGDVTDVTDKQIAVAVGEGSKAALDIIRYFQTRH
jgi:thioredoxin reductase